MTEHELEELARWLKVLIHALDAKNVLTKGDVARAAAELEADDQARAYHQLRAAQRRLRAFLRSGQ